MEQIATAAAQGVTEGVLQQMLAQQAQKVPEESPCPDCGQPCFTHPHPRALAAQGATVQQVERVAHCPACRRDFFPLRALLGLDEHAFSSSVVQCIVTAAARFSSFRDATDAVRMAGVPISENQVRRLAHEVGRELIARRDQKVVEHRRRQLAPRTAVVPEAVVVEVDGGGFGLGPRAPVRVFTRPRTRKTRSRVWPR